MNSIVGPIFNEKIVEKWNLWVRSLWNSQLLRAKKKKNAQLKTQRVKRGIQTAL